METKRVEAKTPGQNAAIETEGRFISLIDVSSASDAHEVQSFIKIGVCISVISHFLG